MIVNTDISDLFFNYDLTEAKVYHQNGVFSHFNEDKLFEIAKEFLNSLRRLGIECPTARQLIDDFFERI